MVNMSNKNTLVFGASLNPDRYSNMAMHRLSENSIDVKAFGLKKGTVSGIEIDTNLVSYRNIHTVTLYVNPKRQEAYYDYILNLNPTRVIFNPGTENPEFYSLLSEASIHYEAACTLVLLSTSQY
jgi:predicted CoA-binding protein